MLDSDLLVDPVARRLLERIEEAGAVPGTDVVTRLQSEHPDDAEMLSGLLMDGDGNEEIGDQTPRAVKKAEGVCPRASNQREESSN